MNVSENSQEERLEHPVLWFSDGIIILQAENSLFKVHQSVLSAHSPVFKDMFSLPQGSQRQDLVDECPLVTLPDSAQDVEHMLRELYCLRPHAPGGLPQLAYLAASIRMGKKYIIDHMHIRVTDQLRRCFPTTLQEYIDGPELSTVCADANTEECFVLLLNLAHEFGLLFVMPAGLYHLGMDTEDVLNGWKDDDNGIIIKLVPENQARLLIGRDRLTKKRSDGIYSWTKAAVDGCKDHSKCKRFKQDRLVKLLDAHVEDAEYLVSWQERWERGLCPVCIEHAKATHKRSQEELWEELPSIWGLPPWEEIRRGENLN